MTDLKKSVRSHLAALPDNGIDELVDLFTEHQNALGYDYVRDNAMGMTREWTDRQKADIDRIEVLAVHGDFRVFWIRLKQDMLYRGKQRTIIERLTRAHPFGLFIFSNKDESVWDFVNLKLVADASDGINTETDKRKLLRRIHIENTERLWTASDRIAHVRIGDNEQLTPFEMQQRHDEAFDVEAVTEKFFEGDARTGEKGFVHYFNDLKQSLVHQTANSFETKSEAVEWAHVYTLQFLNRYMFIHFIQKKGWLGNDLEFLASYYQSYKEQESEEHQFVNDWLFTLYFEAFNQNFSHPQWMPQEIKAILQRAPYLNGGLFKKNDLDDIYDEQDVIITDEAFGEIFEFYQRYNFTIAEDSPVDMEVAVDPEMIGKVYESLVNTSDDTDERGEAGIFYTPRTEIALMCRLALVDHLMNRLGTEYRDHLYELVFTFSEEEKQEADERIANANLWPDLYEILRNLTIVDPAVGSGSFLVGYLTLLTDLMKRANEQIGEVEEVYDIKKRIIGHSLYGVDVKRWAVDVCELRLWLQLIIETEIEEGYRNLRPLLPNLSFNIRQGDSLVQEVGGINLSHLNISGISPALKGRITQLRGEKLKYFENLEEDAMTRSQIERKEFDIFKDILREREHKLENRISEINKTLNAFDAEQIDLLGESKKGKQLDTQIEQYRTDKEKIIDDLEQIQTTRIALTDPKDVPFVWDIGFAEIIEGDKKGFDIVIGNPPYVRQEKIAAPTEFEEEYSEDEWRDRKKAYKKKLQSSIFHTFPEYFGYDMSADSVKKKLTKKNDLYIYFYFHGLSLLNEQGSFCFITSNSWLDVDYGKDLQEFLIRQIPVRMIIDNQAKRSFKHADVNTVICLFKSPQKTADQTLPKFVMFRVPFEQVLNPFFVEEIEKAEVRTSKEEYRVLPKTKEQLLEAGSEDGEVEEGQFDQITVLTDLDYTGDKWGGKYLRAPDIYYTILEKAGDKLVRLGDIADVKFGIKTGSNEFFYLTNEEVEDWGIEKEFLKPVVKSPRECKGTYINPDNLNISLFMCNKSRTELKGTRALDYIKWGENQAFHQRPSCSNRPVWYDLGIRNYPNMVWVKSINTKHVQPLLPEETLVDQRLYEIYYDEPLKLAVSLNSTYFFMFKELYGRVNLGEGVLDTAVYEAEDTLVINPSSISLGTNSQFDDFFNRDIYDVFKECGLEINKDISSQNPKPLPSRWKLDKHIFDMIGLDSREIDDVYKGLCELVKIRLEKANSM